MVGTCRTESTFTSFRVCDNLNLLNVWGLASLQHQLCNSVPLFNFKIMTTVIKKEHLDFTRIIRVNNPSTHVDPVFHGKSRPRGNAPVHPYRQTECDARAHESALAVYDNNVFVRI